MKNQYKVKRGTHVEGRGDSIKRYLQGEIVTSEQDLVKLFYGKFELVGPAPEEDEPAEVDEPSQPDEENQPEVEVSKKKPSKAASKKKAVKTSKKVEDDEDDEDDWD